MALKPSESKTGLDVLNRSRTSTLRIIAATPKSRTSRGAAPRNSFQHWRVANRTVRNHINGIGGGRRFLHLASVPRRTNGANESALKFQPEPIQWYPNDQNQNGANDNYRFDFPKQG